MKHFQNHYAPTKAFKYFDNNYTIPAINSRYATVLPSAAQKLIVDKVAAATWVDESRIT